MATLPAPPPTAVRTRIRGIDMARALAIIGMVMVHVGPVRQAGGGLVGAAYRAPHGRAAIGFIVVAGIGVSLLAGARTPQRLTDARGRLAWRAIVLLPAGVALQELDVDVAVILQYYAAFFLVASAALRLSDRGLLTGAAVSVVAGPVVLVGLAAAAPELFRAGVPAWHDLPRIVRDIVVTGYYPVIVWTAPLLTGMWLGRRDLRAPRVQRALLAGGAAAAAGALTASAVLVAAVGRPSSPADWRSLAAIAPHNEMPLWVVASTGLAVAVVGACLMVARALPRATWPLVALGQLALTVYVLHLFVLDLSPSWLVRDTFASAWWSVARATGIALVAATAVRAVASTGPLERVLRAPPTWTHDP